jgi:NAD(P)-dependent dehydrogenase (short-subunit alcohol dehydrogenase family)
LAREDDVISVLAKPLLSNAGQNHRIASLTSPPALTAALDPLTTAARNLASHLAGHPNKLTQLRFVVLFGSFAILRYLADLERTLTPKLDTPRPVEQIDAVPVEIRAHGGVGEAVRCDVADRSSVQAAAYSVSKAGREMVTRNLAAELQGSGVLVPALRPGIVESAMR